MSEIKKLGPITAYAIAVEHGFRGTEKEWLDTLSAYGIAVANGYHGTEQEWLESLKPSDLELYNKIQSYFEDNPYLPIENGTVTVQKLGDDVKNVLARKVDRIEIDTIYADDELKTTSIHPVQNRVLTEEFWKCHAAETALASSLQDLQSRQASPYNFRGACTQADLSQIQTAEVNDTWYLTDLKYRVTWTGSAWQQSSLSESDYEDEMERLGIVTEQTDNISLEIWDEGHIAQNGSISTTTPSLHSAKFNPCSPDTDYYVTQGADYTTAALICWYDNSYALLARDNAQNKAVTSPGTAAYFKITLFNYGTIYHHDIAVFKGAAPRDYIPSISALDGVARRSVKELQKDYSKVDRIENALFENYTRQDVRHFRSTEAWTGYNANVTGNKLIIGEFSGYDSYVFVIEDDIKIYVKDLDDIPYYSLCYVTNPSRSWQDASQGKYKEGTTSVRYRKADGNLPSADSPLACAAGSLVCITVPAEMTPYIMTHNTDYRKAKPGVINNRMLSVEIHNGYFYYFVPARDGRFLRCKFVHFVDPDSNADGWVQREVDLMEADMKTLALKVITYGEWEMAIMLKDRPDFIGCMNHGSEVATIANIFFDGVPMDRIDTREFACKEIDVAEKSTMYDPIDETTIVGYHYKKYRITAESIRIEQRIVWAVDDTAMLSYALMLPAVRGNDSVSGAQVTDRFYDDKTLDVYNISTTEFDDYLIQKTDKGAGATLYGTTSGGYLYARCDIVNKPTDSCMFLSNAVNYNKLYIAYCGNNHAISTGDVWQWTSKYQILA